MRRPSRQGLLPVRTFGTNVSVTASIVILATLLAAPRYGYTQDMHSVLSGYFSSVRTGNPGTPPADVLAADSHGNALYLLQAYLHDSVTIVRAEACKIVHLIASHSSREDIRRDGIDMLVRSYGDNDHEINGHILAFLRKYSTKDFSAGALDSIRNLVRSEAMHFDQLLKLAGFLGLHDLKDEIRPWAQPGNPARLRWAAYLSLARMGDPFAITAIRDRIRNLPVNDDVVYQVFPDLIYTRQQTLYTHMVDALFSNDKNCLSADAEREVPIPCGYRIMEQFAPVIEGLPFAPGPGGDLNVPDYALALEEARAWFITNKTYTILNNDY